MAGTGSLTGHDAEMRDAEMRDGEVALPFDPAARARDAGLVFIGRVRSPWTRRQDCPRNLTAARETGKTARVEIDADYRQGLAGLEGASHVIVLTWLDRSRRDLIVQKPRHAANARGTFALRSPVRPNPIGLHTVRLDGIDLESGILHIDAVDVLDGTPVVDLKPYFPAVDSFPDVRTPGG